MARTGICLIVTALLAIGARACTGVVYRMYAPISILVVKRIPDMEIERAETRRRPLDHLATIVEDEPQIPFADAYLWLMRHVPAIAAVCMTAGIATTTAARRRASRKDRADRNPEKGET